MEIVYKKPYDPTSAGGGPRLAGAGRIDDRPASYGQHRALRAGRLVRRRAGRPHRDRRLAGRGVHLHEGEPGGREATPIGRSGSPTRSKVCLHPTSALYPADTGDDLYTRSGLSVGADQVRHNFARYGLLDERVKFLVGWFKDTLPTAPIERLSLMRLDGDMYESTWQAIEALYPKLSPGGFCIIDDFGSHQSQAGPGRARLSQGERHRRGDHRHRWVRRLLAETLVGESPSPSSRSRRRSGR